MSDVFRIALSGLNDAALRVANATSNIVNVSSTTKDGKNFSGHDVVSTADRNGGVSSRIVARPEGEEIDLATEIVNAKIASVSYEADAKVVQIASDMQKRLLDELA